MKKMMNVRVDDNGSAFILVVSNGSEQRFVISAHSTLMKAWEQIKWMYEIETQEFTVGKKEIPVRQWIENMTAAGIWEN